jgi:hypothetical protein
MTSFEFRRGLLYGICASGCKSFGAEGPRFHEALRIVMMHARTFSEINRNAQAMLESLDPVFGIYEDAETMILEGIRDCIILLEGPSLQRARFKMKKDDAKMQLLGIPWGVTMARVGRDFAAALESIA